MTNWFALQVTTGDERKVVTSLDRMGFNVQCPVAIERRIRHRRNAIIRQEVEKPIFGGYVFVECEYVPNWFRQERYVIQPLWNFEKQQTIPEHLIINAIQMSGEITINEWKEAQAFATGDSVRHRASGLIGKVGEVRGKKLVMLVELLGKLHRRTVAVEHVEAAE